MKTLEKLVKFIGDYFIVWTIVAAVIGFFQLATYWSRKTDNLTENNAILDEKAS